MRIRVRISPPMTHAEEVVQACLIETQAVDYIDLYLVPDLPSDVLQSAPEGLVLPDLDAPHPPIGANWSARRSISFGGDADPTRRPPVVSPVPEPETWAMMILGFFGLGAVLRRSKGRVRSA